MERRTDNTLLDQEPAVAVPAASESVDRLRAWVLLLGSGVIWGASFSLAKIATSGGAHPLGITLWQGVLGTVLLFGVILVRRQRIPLDRRHIEFYVVCGLLGTAIPGTLFFYAAAQIPAGILSIAVGTVPLLTFVFAIALKLDRFSAAKVMGLLFGMTAIVMIAAPDASLPGPDDTFWLFIGLAAAACYAIENAYIAARRPGDSDAFTVLFGMLTAAAIILAPIVLATDTFVPLALPWASVEWAIFAMSIINIVAYGTFVYLITYAGPVFASQEAYVVTLAGVFWGIVIFDETHSAWVWGALMSMIVGLFLIAPRNSSTSGNSGKS